MSKRRVVFHNAFYDNELGLFRVDTEYDIPDHVVLPKSGLKYLRGGLEDQPGAEEAEAKPQREEPVDPRTRKPRRRRGSPAAVAKAAGA